PGNEGSIVGFLPFNNSLLFSATHPSTGDELYITDGTPQGTQMLADMNPGSPSGGSVTNYGTGVVFNNKVYFSAFNPAVNTELWETDGTTQGTVSPDIVPGATGFYPRYITKFDTSLLMFGSTG